MFLNVTIISLSLSQCIGHISSLLLKSGLKLAALKLMAESKDEQLLTLTLDQIKSITSVSPPLCLFHHNTVSFFAVKVFFT